MVGRRRGSQRSRPTGRRRHAQRRRPVPGLPGGRPGRRSAGAGEPADERGRGRPRHRRLRRDPGHPRRQRARLGQGLPQRADGGRTPGAGRRRRAVLHVGHHRPTQGCRADAPCAGRARSRPRRHGRSCCATTRSSWLCRWRTSWASSRSWARRWPASRSTSSTASRRPGCSMPIEQRRCSAFIGVPTMYRTLLESGAADRDLTSVRVWISGADVMPADVARRFKSFGATATLPGPRARSARRRSSRGTAWSRSAGASRRRCRRRCCPSAWVTRSACRCRAGS